jgi:tetratricopeptide (TPR) repeat protein
MVTWIFLLLMIMVTPSWQADFLAPQYSDKEIAQRLQGVHEPVVFSFTKGNQLFESGQLAEAIRLWQHSIDLSHGHDFVTEMAYSNIARAYTIKGQTASALKAYKKILQLNPSNKHALYEGARCHQLLGNFNDASELYLRLTAIENTFVRAHFARLTTSDASQEDIDNLQNLLYKEPSLSQSERVLLQFTLHHIYEALGDYETAWKYLHNGNQMNYQYLSTSRRNVDADMSKSIRALMTYLFTEPFLKKYRSFSPDTSKDDMTMVFFVGVPRSGSTLLEQVLCSHSMVRSIGEHVYSATEKLGFFKRVQKQLEKPEVQMGLQKIEFPPRMFAQLHDDFLGYVAGLLATKDNDEKVMQSETTSPGIKASAQPSGGHTSKADHTWVVDKTLTNYQQIGLLHLAFPNAKFVYTVRDPMEAMLSNYKQWYHSGHFYSYDFKALTLIYKHHEVLMNHWKAVLPKSALFE